MDIFKSLMISCSLALTAGCATQKQASWTPAEEASVYKMRLEQLFTKGTDGFGPQEAFPGAGPLKPLKLASARLVGAQSLDDARAVAASSNARAFLIWRDGALEEETYFKGVDATTPLISKSLAKPLTAIVVGRAISLGYIQSLDQPVSDFITEWKGTPKSDILIRHLLDMRSGLLPQGFVTDPKSVWNQAYLSARHGEILIRDYPLVSKPGDTFGYSNATSELISIVIERATKMRYAKFVSEKVLRPIGATGGSVWIDRPGGLAHSGCCMSLPAQTWMRLAILLLQNGEWEGKQLLPLHYVSEMRRATPQNQYYGLGVYVPGAYALRRGFNGPAGGGPQVLHSEPYLTQDFFMFDGNANQVVYIAPSERLIVMRLGDAPPREAEWDNAKFFNTILRGLPAPAAGRSIQK